MSSSSIRLRLHYVIAVFGLCFSLSASGNCDPPDPQKGDWRERIFSSEKARYMLDMELAESLESANECIEREAVSGNKKVAGTLSGGFSAQDGAGSESRPQNSQIPSSSETTNSDQSETSGKVLSAQESISDEEYTETKLDPSGGMEPILREAILVETNPSKKEVLRERYRQLIKRDPP